MLSDNARKVLEARYLRRDEKGLIAESPDELFRRVARCVATAEAPYGGRESTQRFERVFYKLLSSLDFLPNSPTLMNAGTGSGQLSACFVLPIGDSMGEIFDSLKLAALIQQSGGGTGFSFSQLRPKGDLVLSTGGLASGPVSFMRIFDAATENIRQGGKRRGANMGILQVDHPDIVEFIEAKRDKQSFRNFNLSVAVTDDFMESVEAGRSFELRHPHTGKQVDSLNAADLFDKIARSAWETGDPGLIFIDTINRAHPTPSLGKIEATNPCGEVPLHPYEACNLGSINLSHMTRLEGGTRKRVEIDWEKLAETTGTAVRFLDDVISVNQWPAVEIQHIVEANRKIGLGVMGFAEMLIQLGVPYGSDASVSIADKIARFVAEKALAASEELAVERDVFPNWSKSQFAAEGRRVRNATLLSIAPTGTIGIIADTTPSIEPLFALVYRREHVLNEQSLLEISQQLVQYAKEHGFYSKRLISQLKEQGMLSQVEGIPANAVELFRTALEIEPENQLRIQAAFQRHVDNAVSKTINLPNAATVEEVRNIYRRAWELGLKGVTIYRNGSKDQQVIHLGTGETSAELEHYNRCDKQECRV